MREQPTNEIWRGKVGKMNEEELDAFLADGIFCRHGCLDAEGWPYLWAQRYTYTLATEPR